MIFVVLKKKHNDIDFVYLDYNESKKLIDTINVSKSILRQHGFIIIIINFEFNQYEILKKNIQNIIELFDDTFKIIQEINLSNYFQYNFMIMMTKK